MREEEYRFCWLPVLRRSHPFSINKKRDAASLGPIFGAPHLFLRGAVWLACMGLVLCRGQASRRNGRNRACERRRNAGQKSTAGENHFSRIHEHLTCKRFHPSRKIPSQSLAIKFIFPTGDDQSRHAVSNHIRWE